MKSRFYVDITSLANEKVLSLNMKLSRKTFLGLKLHRLFRTFIKKIPKSFFQNSLNIIICSTYCNTIINIKINAKILNYAF